MKKLVWFLLSAVLLFSGCSKDDDVNIPEDHPILGTWVFTEIQLLIDTDNAGLKSFLKEKVAESYFEDESAQPGSTVTFQKNGKALREEYPSGDKSEISFRIDGSVITLKAGGETSSVDYRVEGNDLLLVNDIRKECRVYAIANGYTDEIYEAKLVEVFKAL